MTEPIAIDFTRVFIGPPAERFDLQRAHVLARLCQAVYMRGADDISALLGMESTEILTAGASLAMALCNGYDAILIFRGTQRFDESGGQAGLQWLTNINFGQTAFHGCRVHQGFAAAVDAVQSLLNEWTHRVVGPNGRIWLAGHSLGGALAQLAAMHLASARRPVAATYSFGAPRVGDGAFAAALRPPLFRVESAIDPVCHVPPPPAIMQVLQPLLERILPNKLHWVIPTDVQYEHAGQLVCIASDGTISTGLTPAQESSLMQQRLVKLGLAAWWRENLVHDHSIERYSECLATALSQESRPHESEH